MSKKLFKLVLSSLLLAGSIVGMTPKVAQACPQYYCCDPECFGIRLCWRVGGSCLCEEFCRPNIELE